MQWGRADTGDDDRRHLLQVLPDHVDELHVVQRLRDPREVDDVAEVDPNLKEKKKAATLHSTE